MAKITLFVQAIGKTPKKTSKKSNSDVYVDLESAGIRKRKVNTTSPVETIRGAPAITSAGRPTMTAKVKLHIFSLPPKVNANRFKTFSSYCKVFFALPNGILWAIRCNKPNAPTPSHCLPYTPFFANKR